MGLFDKWFGRGKKSPTPSPKPVPAPVEPKKDAPAPSAPNAGQRDISQLRYAIEHKMMCEVFYNDPVKWLILLLEDKLYDLWDSVIQSNGFQNPYRRADFITHGVNTKDGTILVSVELPEPERMPLCYMVHFIFNDKEGLARYYTQEKTIGENMCCMCMWTKDGTHSNMGTEALGDRSPEHHEAYINAEMRRILEYAGKLDTM